MVFETAAERERVGKYVVEANEQNFDRLETVLLKEGRDVYLPNPGLDLVLERIVDIKPELVWKAWTEPEHLKKWFCPLPWTTIDCEIDLRPGGIFRTVMRSPEGEQFPNLGCYLEVIENRKLVFTDALLPGYRPVQKPQSGAGMLFTAVVSMAPHPKGTQYTAIALHKDAEDRKKHEEMGFHAGWGKALDQLIGHMKSVGGQ